ncbi:hypothetical protein ACFQJ7_03970 [Halovenus rubra]|uniref:DNA replication factor GINS n=2 Tax=Halovenus rubra TaxID=869890 RepID=A0ABD5X2K2_9EURY|nr:hypothetical protein [Halovenus rubra]
MDLNELQSVRDRERQTDKLQQLRESFYADAGEFIQQLHTERDRAVDRVDNPFDSPEVRQLSDEIKTAEQTVEAIYEKRVGKIVKAASFAAADLPAEADGMTAEEQGLFENLVNDIESNRGHVLALLDGDEPTAESTGAGAGNSAVGHAENSPVTGTGPADHTDSPDTTSEPKAGESEGDVPNGWDDKSDSTGVTPADVMGGETEPPVPEATTEEPKAVPPQSNSGDTSSEPTESSPQEHESVPPAADPVDPPVRNDGGTETATQETQTEDDSMESTGELDRQRVQMLEGVETFLGFDDRDYDLEADDVVTLPETNADILIEQGVAREL